MWKFCDQLGVHPIEELSGGVYDSDMKKIHIPLLVVALAVLSGCFSLTERRVSPPTTTTTTTEQTTR